jgi:hypothetical protein
MHINKWSMTNRSLLSHIETVSRSSSAPIMVKARVEPSTFWPVVKRLTNVAILHVISTNGVCAGKHRNLLKEHYHKKGNEKLWCDLVIDPCSH